MINCGTHGHGTSIQIQSQGGLQVAKDGSEIWLSGLQKYR